MPPTIVDWPRIRASRWPRRVSARARRRHRGRPLFIEAMQNTYFKDSDVVYRVAVRGVLPGDPAC